MSIVVIADDLTGAAEIAGVAARRGLHTRILRGGTIDKIEHPGVNVIDLESRRCGADEASTLVLRALNMPAYATKPRVYQKVDSLLRGNVIAEINAALQAAGFRRSLLVPQNPSRGRTIRQGRYEIDGVPLDQTDLGRSGEYRVCTADVAELLGGVPVTVSCRPTAADAWPQTGVVVPDAQSSADLYQLASCIDEHTLPCGGSEFFEAWLAHLGYPLQSLERYVPPSGDSSPLWVCGTASRAGREAVAVVRSAGVSVCAMPLAIFRGEDAPALFEAWVIEVTNALRRGPAAVVISCDSTNNPGDPAYLTAKLADLVARICDSIQVTTLWIEGGATAEAVGGRMGWDTLDFAGELAPGVVCLTVSTTSHAQLILKPGSYKWPKQFFDTMIKSHNEEHGLAHD